jgi:flagellar biosynthesis/type III secretory pathway protein FliH
LEAALLQNYVYQSDFAKKYIAIGIAEGKAEGKAEVKAEGEARGMAQALIKVLRSRGLQPDEAALARIEATDEAATLLRWLDRALTADSVGEALTD